MTIQDVEKSERTELWGTFSVKDHLRDRAFVAEVLLYDRLVIPRPPTADEEKPKSDEQSQWTRWGASGWKPGRLEKLLDILRKHELAIEIPWGEQARQDWKKLYDGADLPAIGAKNTESLQLVRNQVEIAKATMPNDAAFIATGGINAAYVAGELQHPTAKRFVALAKTPGVPIEPVIAYASYSEFERQQQVRKTDQVVAPDPARSYAFFGWEFFVPEDTDKSDFDLLQGACTLAARKDLREHRQSFHYWLKQMHEGSVDPEAARADMLKRLCEYRKIVGGSGWKIVTRYAAKAAPVAGPLLHLLGFFAPGVPEILSLGGDVAGAGAPLIVERLLPVSKPDERVRPAALVHDIMRFFGKKD